MDLVIDDQIDPSGYYKIDSASNGQRFGNLIVDTICYYILLVFIVYVIEIAGDFGGGILGKLAGLLLITGRFLYYVLMEYFFGKTVGKFITKSKVVTKNGSRPSFLNIVGRNLCRYIPFNAFSFLFGRGWHDSISATYVVHDLGEDKFI